MKKILFIFEKISFVLTVLGFYRVVKIVVSFQLVTTKALRIFLLSDLYDDEESKLSMSKFWRACFAQRMSLGCYVEVDGKRTLGALNACVVDTIEERVPDLKVR